MKDIVIEFNTPCNQKSLNATEMKHRERTNAISVPRERTRGNSELVEKRSPSGRVETRLKSNKAHNATLNKELIKVLLCHNS